jgi:hypothetical protein
MLRADNFPIPTRAITVWHDPKLNVLLRCHYGRTRARDRPNRYVPRRRRDTDRLPAPAHRS